MHPGGESNITLASIPPIPNPNENLPGSTFNVTFIDDVNGDADLTWTDKMKAAVNQGASLWAQILVSPVTIEIEATLTREYPVATLGANNVEMVFDADGIYQPCALLRIR